MLPRNATLVLVAAVALVAGMTLGAWFSGSRASLRAQPPAPSSTPAEALAPSLHELARAIQALRSTLEELPPATSSAGPEKPEREPQALAPPPRGDVELAAALQALAASLRGRHPGVPKDDGAIPRQALVVPAWVNRSAAFADFGMRDAQQADDELAWDRAMDAFRKKHLFWTTQQVLDAFGKPDEIAVGEQYSTWSYRLAVAEDEEEYTFHISDGLVFSADYSY